MPGRSLVKEETYIAGRYQLIDLIGSGGEARVYRALDRLRDAEVAVRLPTAARPLLECSHPPAFHPGWVELLDAGSDPQRGVFQVFRLLRGETLRSQVQRAKLSVVDWRAFVRESLDAVEALHVAGWVHGDLNAENFLQEQGPAAGWKLLELPFLSAGARDRSILFGSIHTLAPEQLKGHAPNALSDIYALGCLYYYGAAGEYPHPGTQSQEVVVSMLRFPPVPLREKSPDWSLELSQWTMSLLERSPERRPGSVAKARQLLERIA